MTPQPTTNNNSSSTTNNKKPASTDDNNTFTLKDLPPAPMEIHDKPYPRNPTEEEEEEEHAKKQNKEEEEEEEEDDTIIPVSRTKQEYEKAGIPYPGEEKYDRRERHHRLTNANWIPHRKITKIIWFRNVDNDEYLDWNEIRPGKTGMKRNLEEHVEHVTQYEVPIPSQKVEFDPATEEYRTVTAERPQATETRYSVTYSKKRLDRLLKDTINRTTEYVIAEDKGRAYHISKKEIQSTTDFEKLYNKKAAGGTLYEEHHHEDSSKRSSKKDDDQEDSK